MIHTFDLPIPATLDMGKAHSESVLIHAIVTDACNPTKARVGGEDASTHTYSPVTVLVFLDRLTF